MARSLLSFVSGVVLLAPALDSGAEIPSCHCFRDRSFDAARPSAADEYILATTRNSLLSATFAVSKRALVQAEMTGTSPESLWIAYWAAWRINRDPTALLSQRGAGGSWRFALADADGDLLGTEFSGFLRQGAPDVALASVAVDDVMVSRLKVSRAAVAALRSAGASSAEMIVASVVARRTGRGGVDVLRAVRQGGASWGALLRDAGIAPSDLDTVVREIVH